MSARKSAWRSKTLWTAAATVAVGVLQQAVPFIPAEYNGVAMAVIGLAFAALRQATGVPIK